MLTWLKWIIAGRELAELDRWRAECAQAQRWLAEFREAECALYYLRRVAEGKEGGDICGFREAMRAKRAMELSARQTMPEPTLYDVGVQAERGIDYRFLGATGEEDA